MNTNYAHSWTVALAKIAIALAILTVSYFAFSLTKAHAATNVVFFPTTVTARAGQSVSVPIVITTDIPIYTASLRISYPIELLDFTGWTFSPNGIGLSPAGYDSEDETTGLIIKTEGFPTGSASTTLFGTIKFTARHSGTGTLTIGAGSLALDSTNANRLQSLPTSARVVLSAAPAAVTSSPSGGSSLSGSVRLPDTGAVSTGSSASVGTDVLSGTTTSTSTGDLSQASTDNGNLAAQATAASTTAPSGLWKKIGIGLVILIIIIAIITALSRR